MFYHIPKAKYTPFQCLPGTCTFARLLNSASKQISWNTGTPARQIRPVPGLISRFSSTSALCSGLSCRPNFRLFALVPFRHFMAFREVLGLHQGLFHMLCQHTLENTYPDLGAFQCRVHYEFACCGVVGHHHSPRFCIMVLWGRQEPLSYNHSLSPFFYSRTFKYHFYQ